MEKRFIEYLEGHDIECPKCKENIKAQYWGINCFRWACKNCGFVEYENNNPQNDSE